VCGENCTRPSPQSKTRCCVTISARRRRPSRGSTYGARRLSGEVTILYCVVVFPSFIEIIFSVTHVFGIHLWSTFPLFHCAIGAGPVMAHSDRFAISIVGRGGHGSMPHDTSDPIVAAGE
jgi:hypothetical protein